MRSYLRIGRALSRKTKSLAASKEELLSEVATLAKAESTKFLGNTNFLQQASAQSQDATAKFNAAVKELTDKGIKLAAATQAVIDKQPALYEATQAALFKPVTKA